MFRVKLFGTMDGLAKHTFAALGKIRSRSKQKIAIGLSYFRRGFSFKNGFAAVRNFQ
jgi:hypothetical protein